MSVHHRNTSTLILNRALEVAAHENCSAVLGEHRVGDGLLLNAFIAIDDETLTWLRDPSSLYWNSRASAVGSGRRVVLEITYIPAADCFSVLIESGDAISDALMTIELLSKYAVILDDDLNIISSNKICQEILGKDLICGDA